jgi:TRAP-type C4-dicarboxylate transport system permease small subunit
MKLLRKADRLCAIIERAAIVVLFTSLVALIFFNIVSRSVFQASFHKILEIVPAIVLWLALIGASVALREGRHIKIELFLRFLPESTRHRARRVSAVFGMAVMGTLFQAAAKFVGNEIAIFGWIGGISIIFPIFFALSFLRYLIQAIEPVAAPPKGGRSAPLRARQKGGRQ